MATPSDLTDDEVGSVKPPSCDACLLAEKRCPGLTVHCSRGEHCIDTDATCATDDRADDHGLKCCFCGTILRTHWEN